MEHPLVDDLVPPADPTTTTETGRRAWRLTQVAGPDAGPSLILGPGDHRLGRHPRAEVPIGDPALEAFHVVISIDELGRLAATQLAGRRPLDLPVARGGIVHASHPLRLELGATVIELHPAHDLAHEPERPEPSAVVRRSARTVPTWSPVPIRIDGPHGSGDGDDAEDVGAATRDAGLGLLVPAGIALAGAVLMAALLQQPLFAVFGLLGALTAVASWAVQHRVARRRHGARRRHTARADDALRVALAAQRDARRRWHDSTTSSLCTSLLALHDREVWDRRPDHVDAWTVALGTGDVRWTPVLSDGRDLPPHRWAEVESASTLHDVGLPVDLGPGARLGLRGPGAPAVLRALVAQLAVRVGPADWQLVVVADTERDVGEWRWLDGLPHLAGLDGATALDEEATIGLVRDPAVLGDRHTVVVTDRIDALAVRTSALRRLLAGRPGIALVALVGDDTAPASCTALLTTRADGTARWVPDVRVDDVPSSGRWAGLREERARAVVAGLARLRDPEDPRHEGAIPSDLDLAELLGIGSAHADAAAVIEAAWTSAAPDAPPTMPIGRAADGLIELDLVRDGPHALVAGTTGSGKSELLRSLVVGLAARHAPDRLSFVLVDYKGGAAFDVCAHLPHVVGTVTDLDDQLAERALRSLRAELRHRERILRALGAADLDSARRTAGAPVLARLVVVVDEFAALAAEHPGFLHALVDVAQRGRSLGVHLVLATQRPSGVVSDDIRANTNLRVALRVQDAADSIEVLGDPTAALLARRTPGRAVLRLGADELVTFQTARVSPRLVQAVALAATRQGALPARAPWVAPLPERLTRSDRGLAGGPGDGRDPAAVGLVDLPDEQRTRPLVWTPTDGNVLVVGSVGSGVGSTLRTLAGAAVRAGARIIVIDATHDPGWDEVVTLPTCLGVVRPHQHELLLRALTAATAGDGSDTGHRDARAAVVVIDGVAALRAALDVPERTAEADLLQHVLGAPTGPVLVLGADAVTGAPPWLCSRMPHRWLLHLDDRSDAPTFGIAATLVPPPIPGRCTIVGHPDAGMIGAAAQVVAPAVIGPADVPPGADHPPVARLRTLSAEIDARTLPLSTLIGAASDEPAGPAGWLAVIGTRFDSLAPATVEVPAGEHVLVLGPGRSGRSTCLVRLAVAWRDAHDLVAVDGRGRPWVGVLTPRRSALSGHGGLADLHALGAAELLDGLPDHGAALLVIDDAELVDDVDGRLAAVLSTPRPGLCAVVAARPDGLRARYGHWTAAVRRSRLGLVATSASDLDGDLLGAALPRRAAVPPRPGLVHVIGEVAPVLAQVASDPPRAGTARRSGCPIVVGA